MSSLGFTGRVSAWSARHPWRVIAAWLVLTVAITAVSQIVGGVFSTDISFTNAPESQVARNLLKRWQGQPLYESIVISSDRYAVASPEFRAFVTELTTALRQHPDAIDATQTTNMYEIAAVQPGAERALVSRDGKSTLISARILGDVDSSAQSLAVVDATIAPFRARPGFTLLRGGYASANQAFIEAAQRDLSTELRMLPVILIVLVVVFGAAVAALVPLGMGVVAITITFGVVTLLSRLWALSTFVTNIVTGIGLAVGIDYALFTIARYREQRRAGHDVVQSIAMAGDTASRAVVFSGATVVVALTGMLIVPTSIFQSMGLGASLVVLCAVAATLTLLPAIISLLGDRINRLAVPFISNRGYVEGSGGFWAWVAGFVMRRALIMMVLAAALLVTLALPYARIRLGAQGTSGLPERYEAKRALDVLNAQFVSGFLSPTSIVVSAPDVTAPPVQQGIGAFMQRIAGDGEIRLLGEPRVSPDRRLAVVNVALAGDLASRQAQEQIGRLRGALVPAAFAPSGAQVYVGGQSAANVDFFALVDRYTPIVFAYVLGLSFIVLLLAFRSLVVPLKAVLMNLLSVGAAYGVLVAVFQWGWAPRVLGFGRVDAIEAWLPLMMFTILFGLSMDYHVFLLSRIRERFDQTQDNAGSVAFGLRSTANIITGAAAIMVAVFAGFAMGELVMFQQLGVGLAVAVFLDATIIRTILVPSTMRLLGDANWYLPRWLRWLPDLRVERTPGPGRAPAGGGA